MLFLLSPVLFMLVLTRTSDRPVLEMLDLEMRCLRPLFGIYIDASTFTTRIPSLDKDTIL